MSMWSHVQGTIVVRPCGETTAHSEYILKTVMSHLPDITGDEGGLDYFINKPNGCDSSSSHDEFSTYAGYRSYNLINMNYFSTGSNQKQWAHMIEQQENFIVTIYGDLRRVTVSDCVRQVNKWLCRFAKRVWVTNVNIAITGDDVVNNKWLRKCIHICDSEVYNDMFESFSWRRLTKYDIKRGIKPEVNWTEFLRADKDLESMLPWKIIKKYWPDYYEEYYGKDGEDKGDEKNEENEVKNK